MIYHGNPVSDGVAIGSAFLYMPDRLSAKERRRVNTAQQELENYHAACREAERRLQQIQMELSAQDADKAEIFAAHVELLHDEEIVAEIRAAIEDGAGAVWAIESVYQQYADILAGLGDELLVERAQDLIDVQQRLMRLLIGMPEQDLSSLPGSVIVFCDDLMPSDTATIDRKNVLGIVAQKGGYTSHSAIIARDWGIPAVLGVANVLSQVASGETVILDALEGTLQTGATAADIAQAEQKQRRLMDEKASASTYLHKDGCTSDGVRIEIGLNIGNSGPDALRGSGATDFVGLFRTEFLYMEADHMPTEEEQFAEYKKVLLEYGTRPVTLRTLDIGGDKSLPYFALPKEQNPFLGVRALRLCFAHPDILRTQLRAALRASVYGTLWIMFPMVSGLEDFAAAKSILEEEREKLRAANIAVGSNIKVGVMIETPAAVLMADHLAREVDFASIGTNDLCQYLTAADRMDPAVAQYCRNTHPALYRAIAHTARAFREANKPLSVCGELGGIADAACVLAGIGLRKLSMSFRSVAAVKKALSSHPLDELEHLAAAVLTCADADEVEATMRRFLHPSDGHTLP